MTARRTKLIKESGPYRVYSRVDGTIAIQIKGWVEDCEDCGRWAKSRSQLAREIEEFLNVGTKEED